MQLVVTPDIPEQESVSLATTKTTAATVILELALAQEGNMMIPTLVGTKQPALEIMERSTLKAWDTSWFSDVRMFTFPASFKGKLLNNKLQTRKMHVRDTVAAK